MNASIAAVALFVALIGAALAAQGLPLWVVIAMPLAGVAAGILVVAA